MMEISLQSLIFATCYGAIAVAIWRAGTPFPLWFGFCCLEIPYSFASARLIPAVDLAMLILGLLAGVEALAHALRRERAALVAAISIGCIAVGVVLSDLAYLSIRHSALAGFALLFTVAVLLDWSRPLDCGFYSRVHLRLLCAWLVARTWSSLVYGYGPATMRAWRITEWAFLAALALIAAAYSLLMVRRDRRSLRFGLLRGRLI